MELRASEFGSCLRAQVAKALGFSPREHDDATLALFARGVDHETECLEEMRVQGWLISHEQEEVEFLGITGHLDAVGALVHGGAFGQERVVEVKSPISWAKFEQAYKTDTWTDDLSVKYSWQVSLYQHATGLECVVACLNEGRVKMFVIEKPIHSAAAIDSRIESIEKRVALQALDWPCDTWANPRFCQMSAVTGCRDKTLTEDEELDGLVNVYRMAKAEADRVGVWLDRARKDVETALGDRDKVSTAYCTVTRYPQAGPFKWDTDAMEADGVDVDKYRLPGAVSSRVKITIREDADATPAP